VARYVGPAPGAARHRPPWWLLDNEGMSIVKINVLTVPEEQRETLEKRFASRAGTVDSSDGFEWFELLRPVEGTDSYLVYTRWRAEEDFQNWMSGRGQAAHRDGAAGGERPKPAATDSTLWTFEVVQQAAPRQD
jgi:heme-degrading monooxygenase HmoA